MVAAYYWYAWFALIIVYFFIRDPSCRHRLLFLLLLIMTTYSIYGFSYFSQLLTHFFLLMGYGSYLWLRKPKRILQHLWPMGLSLGYASIQLFLVVHPVWLEFPGIQFSLLVVIYFITAFKFTLESTVGLWLLVNSIGSLWSYGIFTFYRIEGILVSEQIIVFVLKGLVIILLFHGLSTLRKDIQQNKSQSSKKGAAYI